jgi:hypothetical protein
MANEVSVSVSLQVNNGNMSFVKRDSYTADQSAAGGPSNGVQEIGTSHEIVSITDITNKGFVYFGNLDTANYVEIGVDVSSTFYPLIKLGAGESATLRLSPSVAVYAQANTAAVKLETYCFEA